MALSQPPAFIWTLFTLESGEVIIARPGKPLAWFDGEKEIPLTQDELREVYDQIVPPGYHANGVRRGPRIPRPTEDPRPQ